MIHCPHNDKWFGILSKKIGQNINKKDENIENKKFLVKLKIIKYPINNWRKKQIKYHKTKKLKLFGKIV